MDGPPCPTDLRRNGAADGERAGDNRHHRFRARPVRGHLHRQGGRRPADEEHHPPEAQGRRTRGRRSAGHRHRRDGTLPHPIRPALYHPAAGSGGGQGNHRGGASRLQQPGG